ncbi:MAG: hypothetical protein IBJ10_02010 [Phycisphaerales bacterium]|nr:hypothetical protein [Phycisphaerales bacterium]
MSPLYANPASLALCAIVSVGALIAIVLAVGRRGGAPTGRTMLALATLGGAFILTATLMALTSFRTLHLQLVFGFAGLAGVTAALWLGVRQYQRQRRIRRDMLCVKCEYPMRDVLTETCPECGHLNAWLHAHEEPRSDPSQASRPPSEIA